MAGAALVVEHLARPPSSRARTSSPWWSWRRSARPGGRCPGTSRWPATNNTTFAALGPISLTSVDQAARGIGRNAARLLLQRIADRGKPSVQVRLSSTLVERRTTARPGA
uniref:substrate-binding domain-containing protein n=1 Tax=Streptomyces hawaiiensis TaxID=67305 RepID=UPI0031DB18A8